MSDVERVLIGSLERGRTKGGKPVVNLFSTDTRLEYPVLTLFDLSQLEAVGIDANDLGPERVYRRFWAFYTESDKTTSKGNPYRDLQYLEPIDSPTNAAKTDTGALLAEVRVIRALLEILVDQTGGVPMSTKHLNLGDTDENADWIPDAETRQEERAIHDDLQAQHAAVQNGNGNAPMGAEAIVAWLNQRGHDPHCQGVGHLLYVVKKVYGEGWGWPVSDDQDGWNQVVEAWDHYWEALA